MELWSVSHRNLQLLCADFWSTAEDCQSILDEIGISSGRINLSEPSIMRWMSIIRELMRKNDGSMARLVVVLTKQYPDNKQLADVCAPWVPSQPAKSLSEIPVSATTGTSTNTQVPDGAVLVKKFEDDEPKPKPKPVPVIAPPDFVEDATLVLPRIDTLWAAMIDVEQRLVELEKLRADIEKVYAKLEFVRDGPGKPDKKANI